MKYLITLSFILYVGSMFLPGLVYEPDLADNEKYVLCSSAIEYGNRCEFLSGGYQCTALGKDEAEDPANRKKILDYCGSDWNVPVAHIDYGYNILAYGFLGILGGIIGWYGNPLYLFAFILFLFKKYHAAYIISLAAFVVGLTALLVREIPRNEGGVHNFVVDHLGSGYYLWLTSIALLAFCSYRKYTKEKTGRA